MLKSEFIHCKAAVFVFRKSEQSDLSSPAGLFVFIYFQLKWNIRGRASQSASVWWCVLSSCWKYPSVGSNLCSESSPGRTQPAPLARKVWRIPAGVVWGLQGNGKCWFILKLFASLCIQLQSRRDVYHSPASQPATDYEEISNKTLWFPNHQHCQLQLLVLMNKNLMSDTTDIFKMWRQSRAGPVN